MSDNTLVVDGLVVGEHMVRAWRDEIKELQAQLKHLQGSSEWVSVDDRLPDGEGIFLAMVNGFDHPITVERIFENCNPFEESYFKDFYYWDMYGNDGALDPSNDSVTHWQPLPACPSS